MSLKQNDPEPIDGTFPTESDPTAEEVNELRESLDEAKAMRRTDVLEDMLDVMNE